MNAKVRETVAHSSRDLELVLLGIGSLLVGLGLCLVYSAKTIDVPGLEARRDAGELCDLNHVSRQEDLLPYLSSFEPPRRELAAWRIFTYLQSLHGRPIPYVGALANLTVTPQDVSPYGNLVRYTEPLESLRQQRERLAQAETSTGWTLRLWNRAIVGSKAFLHGSRRSQLSVPLFDTTELVNRVKPFFLARIARQFRRDIQLWTLVYFAGFYFLHFWWRWRHFDGDQLLLPVIQILAGIGFMLMISLRDPFRDTLSFVDFAIGVAGGCCLMAAFSSVDYERLSRWVWTPLLGSIAFSLALLALGNGPGFSDAKVNLSLAGLLFQPVGIVKPLLVFFMAGYFASRWEFLRHLKARQIGSIPLPRWLRVPRLDYFLPVVVCVTTALLFFYAQKDLGPAIVTGCLFLALYAIARNRFLLVVAALAYSERWRSAFRGDGDQRSEVMAIAIPR